MSLWDKFYHKGTALVLVFILSRIFLRYYLFNKGRPEDQFTPFKVPLDGGALKLMPKDSDGNIKLRLAAKQKLTDDTYVFKFALGKPEMTFGLPPGNHVVF